MEPLYFNPPPLRNEASPKLWNLSVEASPKYGSHRTSLWNSYQLYNNKSSDHTHLVHCTGVVSLLGVLRECREACEQQLHQVYQCTLTKATEQF